jgi:hypothetical protein
VPGGEEEGPDVDAPAVPDPPETGDAEVDVALSRLTELVRGPLAEHVSGYEAVHRELQDRLADVEE